MLIYERADISPLRALLICAINTPSGYLAANSRGDFAGRGHLSLTPLIRAGSIKALTSRCTPRQPAISPLCRDIADGDLKLMRAADTIALPHYFRAMLTAGLASLSSHESSASPGAALIFRCFSFALSSAPLS